MRRAIGGEEVESLRVRSGALETLVLGSMAFERSQCLFAGPGGLDLSVYTSGIICGDLMARCTVILDYARQRVAFVPQSEFVGEC